MPELLVSICQEISDFIPDNEKDLKDVKVEVFRFKYIAWTAIVIFVLATDKFNELLRLL